MIGKLKALFARYREQISYLIFGVATTAVNWIVYYLLMLVPFFASGENTFAAFGQTYRLGYLIANALAFVAAVVFSYWANRNFVFGNKVHGAGAVLKQFLLFAGTRLLSFGIEEALMFVSVEFVGMGEKLAKIPVAVIVVILNYVFGKLLVFRKKKGGDETEASS